MKLHEALRKTILEYGTAVLEERSLVSLLEGDGAFGDCPDMLPVMEAIFTRKYGHALSIRSSEPERTDLSLYLDYLGKSLVKALGFRRPWASPKSRLTMLFTASPLPWGSALTLRIPSTSPLGSRILLRRVLKIPVSRSGRWLGLMMLIRRMRRSPRSRTLTRSRPRLTRHPLRQKVPVMSPRLRWLTLPRSLLPWRPFRRVRSQMSLLLTAPETPRRGTLKRCLSRPLRQNQQSAPESLVITLRQSHLPEMLPLRQSHLPPATRALSFTRGVRCTATGAGRGRTTPRR